jgi:hypothetical protein
MTTIYVEHVPSDKGYYATVQDKSKFFTSKTAVVDHVRKLALSMERNHPYRPNAKANTSVSIEGIKKPGKPTGTFPEDGMYMVIGGKFVEYYHVR